MKEEHEQWKEAHKREEKKEIQYRNRVNKSFEKIPRFDGTNPAYCFDWLTQVEALVNDNEGRNYREELLCNCGISVTKMIQAVPQWSITPGDQRCCFTQSFRPKDLLAEIQCLPKLIPEAR